MFHLLLAIIYLAFISLGLPDSLLGAAWPSIYPNFNVPVSFAGIISMIIAIGTIISSLQSDRLTKKIGTGKVMVVSVAMTAVALFGFSISDSFIMLCIWAVPYGLGAGSVDASLNNYVALHYESRHMSWLHCMWGVGATAGPYIMGFALSGGQEWNMGYRYIFFIQIILTVILTFSLPLWNKKKTGFNTTKEQTEEQIEEKTEEKPLLLKQIIRITGAKEVMVCFFCYCALEQTAGLWASSYLTIFKGLSAEDAAGFAGLFFIGITIGRALSGFLTIKLKDKQMIRLGYGMILLGLVIMILPLNTIITLIGFVVVGLGCAPIYPCIIHSTPAHFGADKSQAIIGVQMASAYVGTCIMPPLFGWIAGKISVSILPLYLFIILAIMVIMHELLVKKTAK